MKVTGKHASFQSFRSVEGKGTVGCLFFLLALAVAGFIGARIGPPYYANKSLETDVKTEASRAGAHFYDDETVMRNVLDLARRNEIPITRENVTLERAAGQIYITIAYSLPVDFLVVEKTINFKIKASSLIGRL